VTLMDLTPAVLPPFAAVAAVPTGARLRATGASADAAAARKATRVGSVDAIPGTAPVPAVHTPAHTHLDTNGHVAWFDATRVSTTTVLTQDPLGSPPRSAPV
jgi:hypothetical protein